MSSAIPTDFIRCPACEHPMLATVDRCPECGSGVDAAAVPWFTREARSRLRFGVLFYVVSIVFAVAVPAVLFHQIAPQLAWVFAPISIGLCVGATAYLRLSGVLAKQWPTLLPLTVAIAMPLNWILPATRVGGLARFVLWYGVGALLLLLVAAIARRLRPIKAMAELARILDVVGWLSFALAAGGTIAVAAIQHPRVAGVMGELVIWGPVLVVTTAAVGVVWAERGLRLMAREGEGVAAGAPVTGAVEEPAA